MGLFKKKPKEPEVLYDSKISLDGGTTFFTAEEIWPVIEKMDLWGKIYDTLDPEILNRIKKNCLVADSKTYLKKYLSYSPVDLVYGNKKDVIIVQGEATGYKGKIPFSGSPKPWKWTYLYNNVLATIYCCGSTFVYSGGMMDYSVCLTASGFDDKRFSQEHMETELKGEILERLCKWENTSEIIPPGVIIKLCNLKFFFFGGEVLSDCLKEIETPSEPTFSNISEETIAKARDNLEKCNWDVDYVITAYAPNRIHTSLAPGFYTPNIITNFFDELEEKLKYKHWYVGGYNMDWDFGNNITALCYKNACINGTPKFYDEIEIKPQNK